MASISETFQKSSGTTVPVWEATCPQSSFPRFDALKKDTSTSVCVIGGGIAGITTAYEIHRNLRKPVVLIEAREVLAGETARTTGHLSSGDQGDRFYNLIKTFGESGAKLAYESHQYAVNRVGEISRELNIDCEYRKLPAKIIKAPEEENDLQDEYEATQKLGLPSSYNASEQVGDLYKGPTLTVNDQGTFHPTKYLVGILEYLKKQKDFTAYTQTRYVSHERKDGKLQISVKGASGADHTVSADSIVIASNMPPRKISHVIKQHYMRSYVIAAPVAKDAYKDILLYDNKDPYVYVRLSEHSDPEKQYLIVGGEDHKVGIEDQSGYDAHFSNLEAWMRENFSKAGQVEYRWSGQVVENAEGLAYIGQSGDEQEYIVTGDNGNGLTHGTLAAKIITDQIAGTKNPWGEIYSPARTPLSGGLGGIYETAKENIVQQKEYLRLVTITTGDIEDLKPCSGKVIRGPLTSGLKPLAVYKDQDGKVSKFSALCPHMKGVVAWNPIEQSWDCPNHGSRFGGASGECVMGPAKMGLSPENEAAEEEAKGSANV
ncbi:protein of unknown function [Taphrina deformans PYCC 5710]|uniref:Rieske domain-containing protein n=1 Tax=Taphrina deformans (strain PYCC 5710 / ATCC 11124 / CBS 356.35 / IMI 108563 / JCM 9778 / NBRC 8474) TaxID=1097556 RepID=R4XFT4_TAPDE|nr:protein of unknown function [Taphrina deformans PYCC 5710]|eukprot:CCG84726.1 protein of unknown function [Taphrina deformans PYCC 5710]